MNLLPKYGLWCLHVAVHRGEVTTERLIPYKSPSLVFLSQWPKRSHRLFQRCVRAYTQRQYGCIRKQISLALRVPETQLPRLCSILVITLRYWNVYYALPFPLERVR